jgi:hypothetical protein
MHIKTSTAIHLIGKPRVFLQRKDKWNWRFFASLSLTIDFSAIGILSGFDPDLGLPLLPRNA